MAEGVPRPKQATDGRSTRVSYCTQLVVDRPRLHASFRAPKSVFMMTSKKRVFQHRQHTTRGLRDAAREDTDMGCRRGVAGCCERKSKTVIPVRALVQE